MEYNVVVELDGEIDDAQIDQLLHLLGPRLHAAVGWDQQTDRAHVTVTLEADAPVVAGAAAVREAEAASGALVRAFEVLPTIDFDARYGLTDTEV